VRQRAVLPGNPCSQSQQRQLVIFDKTHLARLRSEPNTPLFVHVQRMNREVVQPVGEAEIA
jgi:hypothetical protein